MDIAGGMVSIFKWAVDNMHNNSGKTTLREKSDIIDEIYEWDAALKNFRDTPELDRAALKKLERQDLNSIMNIYSTGAAWYLTENPEESESEFLREFNEDKLQQGLDAVPRILSGEIHLSPGSPFGDLNRLLERQNEKTEFETNQANMLIEQEELLSQRIAEEEARLAPYRAAQEKAFGDLTEFAQSAPGSTEREKQVEKELMQRLKQKAAASGNLFSGQTQLEDIPGLSSNLLAQGEEARGAAQQQLLNFRPGISPTASLLSQQAGLGAQRASNLLSMYGIHTQQAQFGQQMGFNYANLGLQQQGQDLKNSQYNQEVATAKRAEQLAWLNNLLYIGGQMTGNNNNNGQQQYYNPNNNNYNNNNIYNNNNNYGSPFVPIA